jgi:spore maturation protein A
MNKIWMFILAFCFVYAAVTDNLDKMLNVVLEVPSLTLKLLITVGSLIIIYNGIFNMAIASGVIGFVSRLFIKLSYKLFPDIPKDNIIHQYICSNITANLLGLGLASTPIALNTISEMKKLNNNQVSATKEMITLIVINITSFTIFPLTIISLRETYHSKIGIYIWLSLIAITFLTSLLSLLIDRVMQKVHRWNT